MPIDESPQSAIVQTRKLCKKYIQHRFFSRRKFAIHALIDVDLEIAAGSITALVGESGSGKSTLANCVALLEKPDGGQIFFSGDKITDHSNRALVGLRPRVQMVFQDSAGALNPWFSAAEIIAEPMRVQGMSSATKLQSRACELMEEVGLCPDWAHRRPSEFSGGQRQRLAIARALALKPRLLILDESLSGLDLSTQAQIVNLLLDLKESRALSLLLISHDLSLVGQIADHVAIMHQGRIVEQGSRQGIFVKTQQPYTQELLSSMPTLHSRARAAHAGERG